MKSLISTLAIATILLTACGSNSNVKEPEYRDIRDIHLVEAGILNSTAGLDVVYFNPNNFGLTLSEARGDIYIDNEFLGRFELDHKVSVKRNSEFIVPALIKVDMISAIKNHRDLIKKKEALVRIEGSARVNKAGFSKDVPLKFESMQNIERLRSLISLK